MKKCLYLVIFLAGCAQDPYADASPEAIKKASAKARPVVGGGPLPGPEMKVAPFPAPGQKDVMLPPPAGEHQPKPLIIRG